MRTLLIAVLMGSLLVGVFGLPPGCSLTSGVETGTLRLLVIDKPFPVDLIERADLTITRVEVLPADAGDETADEDEADGENGVEGGDGESFGLNDPDASDTSEQEGDYDDAEEEEEEIEDGDADGDTDDDADSDADDDVGSAFITIFQGEKVFNLLSLRNGRSDLLAETEIPAGTYTQMRLIVTEGVVRLTDGREFRLRVPSGSQTGIKLHFTFEIAAERETTLLLDVDLSRAFKPTPGGKIAEAGKIREFKFRPSLAMRLINLLQAGSIAGTVTDVNIEPIAGVHVTAYNGEVEVTSTSTESDGTYVLSGLATGEYRVELSATDYADGQLSDIEVTAGEQAENTDVILAVLLTGEPGEQP